jgi:hypothetical protein
MLVKDICRRSSMGGRVDFLKENAYRGIEIDRIFQMDEVASPDHDQLGTRNTRSDPGHDFWPKVAFNSTDAERGPPDEGKHIPVIQLASR